MAQPGRMIPKWVNHMPKANAQHHYYYRVTVGEGGNYDNAYANAFAKAILEASMKLGVRVRATDTEQSIEDAISKKISMDDFSMEIPINKVCEFTEDLYSPKRIRIYVLWQVANDALKSPEFDEYNDCE